VILVQNEYFAVTEIDQKLFIHVFSSGFSIRDFQIILEKYPRIAITKFLALKEALESPVNEKVEFGKLKSMLTLSILADYLEAKLTINLDQETFGMTKDRIREETLSLLSDNKIVYGILYDVINKELRPNKEIVIAKGTLPKTGDDASIVYLEPPEMKPSINEDGSTNYYDMNLFAYVKKGDWLGEKVFATPGEQGMNIKGEVLPGKPGKDKVLRFDQTSVLCTEKGNKMILSAKYDGALEVKQGKIGVADHLVIEGNIGPETGNIDFEGFVTIKGTVEDGFSVTAGKDISILGNMGMGSVQTICSKYGNIYIKGGISGKGKSIVTAGKSVFVKYANACCIKAKEGIHIGFYALDTQLEADTILVQAKNGRTIGGTIMAKTKVCLRMVGNIYEKETYIHVEGFDRRAIKKQLDELLSAYKELLTKAEQNERELKIYEIKLNQFGRIKSDEDYLSYQKIHQDIIDKIYLLEEERQELIKILSSKGEGEVTIYEKAFPRTFLQIKSLQKRIKEVTSGTFYAQDNQLMFN
jgi:uncharacterized protein (DUF342 family)